ncbi:hypothetical protein [Desulfomicrobium salsuginis]
MDLVTTQSFLEFQAGVDGALAELDKLSRYCADTIASAPSGALRTVEDLEGRIKDASDLIRAHLTMFKHNTRKVEPRVMCSNSTINGMGINDQRNRCRANEASGSQAVSEDGHGE